MTLILIAPGIEKKLSDINDTLKGILGVMSEAEDDQLAALTATLKKNTDDLESALQNQPQQPTTEENK